MLLLVLADNFLLLFLGGRAVGVCSYFLIGFWFVTRQRVERAQEGDDLQPHRGRCVPRRVVLIYERTGSLDYHTVFAHLGNVGEPSLVAIGLLLFAALSASPPRSRFIPCSPDAMEGPTPVSALIHAATMVTAGVYLMCRIKSVLYRAPDAAHVVVAIIRRCDGAARGDDRARAQNDIKKILAYSTISAVGATCSSQQASARYGRRRILLMLTHVRSTSPPVLGSRLGDTRDERRSGREDDGGPRAADADHRR